MSDHTVNLSDAVAHIFKGVLEDAAESCAEEAARVAANAARRHVKEAFAKFVATTRCDAVFETNSVALCVTISLPEALIAAGKDAMLSALIGKVKP